MIRSNPGTIGWIHQNGMWIVDGWNTGHVLLGRQDMSYLEHRKCFAWTARNLSLQTHGMSFFEHKECFSPNTRNVRLRTHGMFFLEHTKGLAWNRGNHGGPARMAGWAGGPGHVARMFTKIKILKKYHKSRKGLKNMTRMCWLTLTRCHWEVLINRLPRKY